MWTMRVRSVLSVLLLSAPPRLARPDRHKLRSTPATGIPRTAESSLSSGGGRPLCSTCRNPASRLAPATIFRSAARARASTSSAPKSASTTSRIRARSWSRTLSIRTSSSTGSTSPVAIWPASTPASSTSSCRNCLIAGSGQYGFSLILFGGNQAQLIFANPPQTSPGCAFLPVPGASCGISANAATGVFRPVSEPETLALMLAGLGAIGFVARRRRR